MSFLNKIQQKNILVVGDVMLDTYFIGDVKRISPEAPVPVFRKKSERSVLGGAANVAANLIAAGQNVSMMAMVGKDANGNRLKELFENQGIRTDLILSLDRHTTEKTRFLANNNQQVMRLDVEDTEELSVEDCQLMLEALIKKIETFDLILLSDYLKGLLTESFTQGIIGLAKKFNIPVIVDVKDPNSKKYNGATLLKPNLKELHDLTKMPVGSGEEIIAASHALREKCSCDYVLTTCGAKGMVLIGSSEPYQVDAVGQEVFDVTGAGDTTIAYLATCLVNGLPIKKSVDIANIAAGIQVTKVGTSCVYWSEVRNRLSAQGAEPLHKIINGKAVENFRNEHAGQKIVFTNGCFDILHVGHIRYLREAAGLGDILIIGLNSDASVKRLKGPERPINSQSERAEMLSVLGFVDYVVIFDEDTPLQLINEIQPDVLVKGGDYLPENVVGREEVEDRGGKLVLIPFVEGKSTTHLIEAIRGQ